MMLLLLLLLLWGAGVPELEHHAAGCNSSSNCLGLHVLRLLAPQRHHRPAAALRHAAQQGENSPGAGVMPCLADSHRHTCTDPSAHTLMHIHMHMCSHAHAGSLALHMFRHVHRHTHSLAYNHGCSVSWYCKLMVSHIARK